MLHHLDRLLAYARASRALRDALHLAFGTGLSQALQLVATPFILRLYGPVDYGIYGLAMAWAGIANLICTFRLESTLPMLATGASAGTAAAGVLRMGTGGSLAQMLLVAGFGDHLAQFFGMGPGAWQVLWLVPLLAFSQNLNQVLRSLLIREGAFALASRSDMSRSVVFVGGTLAGFGLAGAMGVRSGIVLLMAQVLANLVAAAYALSAAPPGVAARLLKARWSDIRSVFAQNAALFWAAGIANSISSVSQVIPVWTVAWFFGVEQVGWLAAAQRLVFAPLQLLHTSLGAVLAQRAGRLRAQGQRVVHHVIRFALLLGAGFGPMLLLAGVASPALIGRFLGTGWAASAPTFAAMVTLGFAGLIYGATDCVPLLFRMSTFVKSVQMARLCGHLALCLVAWSGALGYHAWLWIYVGLEFSFYSVHVGLAILLARRQENREQALAGAAAQKIAPP